MVFTSMQDAIRELSEKNLIAKETEILKQLNELISRGLLVIEETSPVLVRDESSSTIRMSQSIRILLRDQEYIEKLESELAQAKETIAKIQEALAPFRQNDSSQEDDKR